MENLAEKIAAMPDDELCRSGALYARALELAVAGLSSREVTEQDDVAALVELASDARMRAEEIRRRQDVIDQMSFALARRARRDAFWKA